MISSLKFFVGFVVSSGTAISPFALYHLGGNSQQDKKDLSVSSRIKLSEKSEESEKKISLSNDQSTVTFDSKENKESSTSSNYQPPSGEKPLKRKRNSLEIVDKWHLKKECFINDINFSGDAQLDIIRCSRDKENPENKDSWNIFLIDKDIVKISSDLQRVKERQSQEGIEHAMIMKYGEKLYINLQLMNERGFIYTFYSDIEKASSEQEEFHIYRTKQLNRNLKTSENLTQRLKDKLNDLFKSLS